MENTNFREDCKKPLKSSLPIALVHDLLKTLAPDFSPTRTYRTESSQVLDRSGCDLAVEGRHEGEEKVVWIDLKKRATTYRDIYVELGHVVFPPGSEINTRESLKKFVEFFVTEATKKTSPDLFDGINSVLRKKGDRDCPRVVPGWAFKGQADCILTEYPDAVSFYSKKALRDFVLENIVEGISCGKIRTITPSTTTKNFQGKDASTLFTVSVVVDRTWALERGFNYLLKDQDFVQKFSGGPLVQEGVISREREKTLVDRHKQQVLSFKKEIYERPSLHTSQLQDSARQNSKDLINVRSGEKEKVPKPARNVVGKFFDRPLPIIRPLFQNSESLDER